MKRFLKNDRYRQSDRDAETMWYRIRGELAERAPSSAPRRRDFRPALGVVASLAVLIVAGSWWLGGPKVGQRIESPSGETTGRSRETTAPVLVAQAPGESQKADAARERGLADAEPPTEANNPALVAPEETVSLADDRLASAVGSRQSIPVAAESKSAPTPSEDLVDESPPATAWGTNGRAAATASRRGVVSGRVVDSETREPLAMVNVLIKGTSRGAKTDSTGTFRFGNLEPGRRYGLQLLLLSYAPLDVVVALPDSGRIDVACELDPIVVETLAALDVEGAKDVVEVQSAVRDHTIDAKTFEKYAIDSVEEALGKTAGVELPAGKPKDESNDTDAPVPQALGQQPRDVTRGKNPFIRGGRDGTPGTRTESAVGESPMGRLTTPKLPASPGTSWGRPTGGSVTGGTTPPNGETFELMYFENYGVNPFVSTDEDALSTFALDVDNASFSLTRSYLDRGVLPPRDAVRVEEFVNALDPGWPEQTAETFALHADGGPSRFGSGYHLLRVGVVGRSVDRNARKPANLVFVIDVSGSMNRESRLGSVKNALRTLVDELHEGDRVGIVIYGSQGEIRLPMTDISRRSSILDAIGALHPGGSTNAAEGLELGYRLARENYDSGSVNRLVLCSDGVANTGGATDAEGILSLVRRASDQGITLSTVGFGMGNYNDVLMEKLADQGDGNYFYVDKSAEARRVFRENLTGLLQTIAREAKIQVEFDPRLVTRWRLLGYENRDVADRDFRNDAVDAGEVGAGHQVTALYEVKLADPPETVATANIGRVDDDAARAGTVRLRWEAPAHDADRAGRVTEIEKPILLGAFAAAEKATSPRRRAQILAAEFAEILRGSYWARGSSLSDLVPVAAALAEDLPDEGIVQDLARMIRQAADLKAASAASRPDAADED